MDKRGVLLEGLRTMMVVGQQQNEILEGFIKLYTGCADKDAEQMRQSAHNALDTLLDAKRSAANFLAEATRLLGDD